MADGVDAQKHMGPDLTRLLLVAFSLDRLKSYWRHLCLDGLDSQRLYLSQNERDEPCAVECRHQYVDDTGADRNSQEDMHELEDKISLFNLAFDTSRAGQLLITSHHAEAVGNTARKTDRSSCGRTPYKKPNN